MKNYSDSPFWGVITAALLIFCSTILKDYKKVDAPEFKTTFQKENVKTYWECWFDGDYTKISVVRGEIFTATLVTDKFGILTLRGAEDLDENNNFTGAFGSIADVDSKAVGTFVIRVNAPIGSQEPIHYIGNLDFVKDQKTSTIKLASIN